jgi:hypothetical protein
LHHSNPDALRFEHHTPIALIMRRFPDDRALTLTPHHSSAATPTGREGVAGSHASALTPARERRLE